MNEVKFIKLSDDKIPPSPISNTKPPESIIYEMKSGGHLVVCFMCGGIAMLNHKVTFNENDEITCTPSLICPQPFCKAHYWINNNQIRMA